MKPPTISATLHYVFAGFVAVASLMVVTSRASIVLREYRLAVREQEGHRRFRDMCYSHSELRETAGSMCAEREILADLSPLVVAFQVMYSRTHTCISAPCGEVFTDIVNRLGVTLVYVALGVVCALFAYSVLARIAAPLVASAVRHPVDSVPLRRIEHQECDYNDDSSVCHDVQRRPVYVIQTELPSMHRNQQRLINY
jgi:hypothetical protein